MLKGHAALTFDGLLPLVTLMCGEFVDITAQNRLTAAYNAEFTTQSYKTQRPQA